MQKIQAQSPEAQSADLCVPIEQLDIAGKTVHNIGGGALMACLDAHITDAEALALALALELAASLTQHGIKQVWSL